MASRSLHKLSARRVETAKKPGTYEDGGGLRLVIDEAGHKRWVIRVTIRGERKNRGLGSFPDVSLEAARDKAIEHRRAAKEGRDLSEPRRTSRAETFRETFEGLLEVKERELSNAKHLAQWTSTMEQYVFPKLGKRPVADITPSEIIAVLQPIWFEKPETASRVLQRMKAVFDRAIVREVRKHGNPTTGVKKEMGKHRKKKPVVHHRALAFENVPDFIKVLRDGDAVSRQCLYFAIMTASRSQEARRAEWSEIDFQKALWTVPAEKMKARKEHSVPLSTAALALLRKMREAYPEADVAFPAPLTGGPLSDGALTKIIKLLKYRERTTVHGFRSCFKEWAVRHGAPKHLSEAALAHENKDKVEAAYQRSRFIQERRPLMEQWSEFLHSA